MNLLTIHDVARKLRVSTQTIWRWARAGKFPQPIGAEGATRWIDEDVDTWIHSKKEAANGSQGEAQTV